MANPENNEKILRYVRENPNKTEDDIAEALQLNIVDVLDSLTDLQKQGLVMSQPDQPD